MMFISHQTSLCAPCVCVTSLEKWKAVNAKSISTWFSFLMSIEFCLTGLFQCVMVDCKPNVKSSHCIQRKQQTYLTQA